MLLMYSYLKLWYVVRAQVPYSTERRVGERSHTTHPTRKSQTCSPEAPGPGIELAGNDGHVLCMCVGGHWRLRGGGVGGCWVWALSTLGLFLAGVIRVRYIPYLFHLLGVTCCSTLIPALYQKPQAPESVQAFGSTLIPALYEKAQAPE